MKHSLLEPPHRAELNGGSFKFLQSLNAKIIDETLTVWLLIITLLCHLPFHQLSYHRRIKHSLLELSHRVESNGGSIVLLQSLDAEIFDKMVNSAAM